MLILGILAEVLPGARVRFSPRYRLNQITVYNTLLYRAMLAIPASICGI